MNGTKLVGGVRSDGHIGFSFGFILTPTAGTEPVPGAAGSLGRVLVEGVHLALEQGTDSKREQADVALARGLVFGLGNNRRLGDRSPYLHQVSVAIWCKSFATNDFWNILLCFCTLAPTTSDTIFKPWAQPGE